MLREIRTFLAVAQRGSFAAAGQRVGLTPSAVAAQMRTLETALNLRLFERTGRSITLNPAGQRAVPLAHELLKVFAQMGMSDTPGEHRGVLRIGAVGSAQTDLLPAALVALRAQAPLVEPELVPGVSLQLLDQVDGGELDMAVMIHPPFSLPRELRADVVRREPFVLIVPPDIVGDDPLALLASQPFVRYHHKSFGGRLVSDFLRRHYLVVQQVLELDEIEAIVRMVEHGLGVALIPLVGLWRERPARIRRVSLGELTFQRELILITRRTRSESPVHQLARACIQAAGEPRADVG
jgi:DNA-binding transcriptional LysR family regulator